MTIQGMDGYVYDLSTGIALFGRIVIDSDDMTVKAFARQNGDLFAQGTVEMVSETAILANLFGIARFHVGDSVRRECMRVDGSLRILLMCIGENV